MPIKPKKMTKTNRNVRRTTIEPNHALINLITPQGFEVSHNSMKIGSMFTKIYAVMKYAPQVRTGWVSQISGLAGTVVNMQYRNIDTGLILEALNKGISRNRSESVNGRDELAKQRAERAVQDSERLLSRIDQRGETLGMLSLHIMVYGENEEEFRARCRHLQALLKSMSIDGRCLAFEQKEAYQAVCPYGVETSGNTDRLMPLTSLLGGFPFSTSGFSDTNGIPFGKNTRGGLVLLDIWKRGGDRSNSNFFIVGASGMGKSFKTKAMIIRSLMMGDKVILVDPEREYTGICRALNGVVIDATGASTHRINPLQVRPAPRDDDSERMIGDLAQHMKTLEIFFSLYIPSMTDRDKAALKETLEELYARFGISWNTDIRHIPNEGFPIISDLYALLKQKASIGNVYENLSFLLRDISEGADRFLWNGHTNMGNAEQSNLICLDTNALQSASKEIQSVQYFNLLTYVWELIARDRKERVLFVADEAHLLINPQVPQSLVFLQRMVKRARKYAGAIAVITQSVVDFLDPSVRLYGQALMDGSCIKIFFGCTGRSLDDLKKLYSLNDGEEHFLRSGKRGEALVMVGNSRFPIKFEEPEYIRRMIGSSGGE